MRNKNAFEQTEKGGNLTLPLGVFKISGWCSTLAFMGVPQLSTGFNV